MNTAPPRSKTLLTGIAAMTVVGSSVGISHTLVAAPLLIAQAIRYAAAAVLLLAVARSRAVPIVRPRGREWLWLAGIAATGLVLFNIAIVRGVASAQPAAIAVAIAFAPIMLGVIGPMLQRQAPRGQVVLAAAIVTAGSVLVEGAAGTSLTGIIWAAVALLCESAFTLLAVPVLPRHGTWGVSLHSVWLGSLMLTVMSLAVEGPAAAARLTAADWAAIGYLAVMVTALAFVLWYSTVAAIGPDLAGLLTGIAPVAAAVTGIATGGLPPGPLVWLGMLVVIGGLAVGLRSRPAPERIAASAPVMVKS